jgi:hypothetical protein
VTIGDEQNRAESVPSVGAKAVDNLLGRVRVFQMKRRAGKVLGQMPTRRPAARLGVCRNVIGNVQSKSKEMVPQSYRLSSLNEE